MGSLFVQAHQNRTAVDCGRRVSTIQFFFRGNDLRLELHFRRVLQLFHQMLNLKLLAPCRVQNQEVPKAVNKFSGILIVLVSLLLCEDCERESNNQDQPTFLKLQLRPLLLATSHLESEIGTSHRMESQR